MIADDEGDVREMLAEYLGGHGWQVLEAANGLEALLHIKRQHPQAVLLDLRMPRLGGVEALKRIHAFDPAITVVVISGSLDDDVRDQARQLGAKAVLDKPIDLSSVLAALGPQTPTPAEPPSLERAGASASPAPVLQPPVPDRTILVVDDESEVREMLEEFLLVKGYRVRGAADAAAAIRELVAAPADVILLDIDMPGLSGLGALPTLRALVPRAAIIMVSGATSVDIAKSALAGGAFDYVTKPLDLIHLTRTIETALAMQDVRL